MLNGKYKLGELFDIPIYVDASCIFLLLMMVVNSGSLTFGVGAALVLAISIVAHELGHALTAAAFGYRTRDITISLLGGCASLIALPRKAWKEFLTALAGPMVSFVLAGIGFVLFGTVPVHNRWLASMFYYMGWMNVMLGAFNLLPGFPMDGGRIFRSVMRIFFNREKATLIAMWVGRALAIVLGFSGLDAILSGGSWGFVRILIAYMIWREGYREYLAVREEERYRVWTQEDFEARVSPPPYDL
jgi:Zn-dependent protease